MLTLKLTWDSLVCKPLPASVALQGSRAGEALDSAANLLQAQGTGGGFASPIEVQETAEYSLPAPDMHAAAAREVTTPFVRLQEPVPLTPVINEAHEQHTKVSACHLSWTALPPPLFA